MYPSLLYAIVMINSKYTTATISGKVVGICLFLMFRHPVFDDKMECYNILAWIFLLYTEFWVSSEVVQTTPYDADD